MDESEHSPKPPLPQAPVLPVSPVPVVPDLRYGIPAGPGGPGVPDPWLLPQPVRPPRTNGFAIAGFVTGLVGIVVLAPVFSLIALRRIRRTGDRGRSMAITGLVLTGCWLAVIALVAALGIYRGSQAGVGQTTAVSNIRVGQCFDADLGKNTLMVAKIADCTGPHAGEAYGTATAALAGLAGKAKDLSAAEGCANSFEDFVGKAYDTSELEIFFVVLEDKEVAGGNILCMLGKPGKQLTGTMRGSGR